MKISVHAFELGFTHPFSISRETQLSSKTVVVKLEDDGIDEIGVMIEKMERFSG